MRFLTPPEQLYHPHVIVSTEGPAAAAQDLSAMEEHSQETHAGGSEDLLDEDASYQPVGEALTGTKPAPQPQKAGASD